VLSGIFGCLRREDARLPEKRMWVGDGPSVSDEDSLLNALLANPMRIEQMLSLSWEDDKLDLGQDKLTNLMVKLASYERDGLIARFPDGRYGPARV